MLQIEIIESPDTIRFEPRGVLRGPQVSELAKAWETKRATGYKKHLAVDLSNVQSVDYLGKELLALMYGYGTELLSKGPSMSALIDDILSCEHGTLAHRA